MPIWEGRFHVTPIKIKLRRKRNRQDRRYQKIEVRMKTFLIDYDTILLL